MTTGRNRSFHGGAARRWMGALALAGAASLLWAGAALAQGTLKARHGDWQFRCDTPSANGQEQCILIQSVLDQSELNLAAVILRVEDTAATLEARKRDPKAPAVRRPVLRVIVPLGVLLPRRLGLKIDEREIGSTEFVRCLESGCIAEVDMDNDLIDAFRKGKVALFAVFLTPQEGRGLPISLKGFDEGFQKLQ